MKRKIRSIPPITSTGSRKRKKPALLEGLAHMSLGRWMSEKRKSTGIGVGNIGGHSEKSWDISKHIFEKTKPKKRPKSVSFQQYSQKVECISDLVEEINTDRDLGVILKFKGLPLSNKFFAKGRKDYGPNTCVYYTHITYKNKPALLIISTTGDIVESEIVPHKRGVNQLFSNELYIPRLINSYNPLSMEVVQNNGLVIVTYKKQKGK